MSVIIRFRKSLLMVSLTMLILGSAFAANADKAAFADCISSSGAKYYGAHWCKYCAKQNTMFGSAVRYLPYVECSARGSNKKLSRCSHISGFPTWIFANGTRRSGVLSFDALQSYTGCRLEKNQKDYFVD
jgi:hypothetical protein